MRKFLLLFLMTYSNHVFAEMQLLPLPKNSAFGAIFPCNGEKKSVQSVIGVANALQCGVGNGSSVCIFLIAEQPLDVQSFNKNGWGFIEEVNHQYALQMDKNYKSVYGRAVEYGGFGKAYAYELTRYQEGSHINVRGFWMVTNDRMLRGTVSCAPQNTSFMRRESEIFLKSFTAIK